MIRAPLAPIDWMGVPAAASFTVNYRSWVYLFRYTADGTSGTPDWLARDGWSPVSRKDGSIVLARETGVTSAAGQYRAHVKYVPSFSSFTVYPLVTNGSAGFGSPANMPTRSAFTVVRMVPDDIPTPIEHHRNLQPLAFAIILPTFVLPQLLLLLLLIPFCWEVQFRPDLIKPYLGTRSLPTLQQSQRVDIQASVTGIAKALKELLLCRPPPLVKLAHVDEFTPLFSREHILASCFLDHPDALRSENVRRRELLLDVARFFGEAEPAKKPVAAVKKKQRKQKAKADNAVKEPGAVQPGASAEAEEETNADSEAADTANRRIKERMVRRERAAGSSRLTADVDNFVRDLQEAEEMEGPKQYDDDTEDPDEDLFGEGEDEDEVLQLDRLPATPSIFSGRSISSALGLSSPGSPEGCPEQPEEPVERRGFFNDIPVPPVFALNMEEGAPAYHRNLFWLNALVYVLALSPWVVCVAHAIVLLRMASPPAAGWAVLLIGTALYVLFLGGGQWAAGGFRTTGDTAAALSTAAVLLLAFPPLVVATDWPLPLDIRNVTAVALTLSFSPLAIAVYLNAEMIGDSLTSIGGLSKFTKKAGQTDGASDPNLKVEKDKSDGRPEMPLNLPVSLGITPVSIPDVASIVGTAGAICMEHALDPAGAATASHIKRAAHEKARAAMGATEAGGNVAKSKPGSSEGTARKRSQSPKRGTTRSARMAALAAAEAAAAAGSSHSAAADVGSDSDAGLSPVASSQGSMLAGFSPRTGTTTMITGIPVSKAFLSGAGVDPDLFPRAVEDAKEYLWVAARRWALKHTGVSLGLTVEDDAALRLAAVATAPWLQPSESFVNEANLLGADPLHPIPARSHTAVLGNIMGPRIYTPLHAAPHAALLHGDGLQGLMSGHPALILRITRLCMTAIYLLHGLYAITIAYSFPDAPMAGVAIAITLAILDFTMMRLVKQKLVNRPPLWFCVLALISRAFLATFAASPWLVGAGLAYATWGVSLGYDAGVNTLPFLSMNAGEFIALLSAFKWGDEFARAVQSANNKAHLYQQAVAEFLGIDLSKDYAAEAAANAKAARAKKKSAKDDDDDDDDDDGSPTKKKKGSTDVGKDPYDLSELRAKAAALEAARAATTPAAARYAAMKKGEASDAPDRKFQRFAGTRVLENRQQDNREQRTTEVAAIAKAARDKLEMAKQNAAVKASSKKRSKKVAPMPEPPEPGMQDALSDGPVQVAVKVSAPTVVIKAKKSLSASLVTDITNLAEAWAALLVLTLLYLAALLAQTFYDVYLWAWARAQPTLPAGLFDSEIVIPIPGILVPGMGSIPVWLLGSICIAVSLLAFLIAGAATAQRLRSAGLLPPSFDVLLPFMTKYSQRIPRVPYPIFLAVMGEIIGIGLGALVYFGLGSISALLICTAAVPIALASVALVAIVWGNGGSLVRPGFQRVMMTRPLFVLINARAGYPLRDSKSLKKWKKQLSARELIILANMELDEEAPRGHIMRTIPILDLPCMTGDAPLLHTNDISAAEAALLTYAVADNGPGESTTGSGGGGASERRNIASSASASGRALDASRSGRDLLAKKAMLDKSAAGGKSGASAAAMASMKEETDAIYEEDEATMKDLASKSRGSRSAPVPKRGILPMLSRWYYRWMLQRIDPSGQSVLSALARGWLPSDDVHTLNVCAGLLLLLGATGGLIMAAGSPVVGVLVFLVPTSLLCTVVPAVSYAVTQEWTFDLILPLATGAALTTGVLGVVLVRSISKPSLYDIGAPFYGALWAAYWGVASLALAWRILLRRYMRLSFTALFLLIFSYGCLAIVLFVVWNWVGFLPAVLLGILLLASVIALIVAPEWQYNSHIVPAWLLRSIEGSLVLIAVAACILPAITPVSFLVTCSVAMLSGILYFGSRATVRFVSVTTEGDSPLLFSSLLLPAFSYDPHSGGMIDESRMVKDGAAACALAIGWAIYACMFVDPTGTGVASLCAVLAVTILLVLSAAAHTPLVLGQFAAFLDASAIRGARVVVTDLFHARRRLLPVSNTINTSGGASVLEGYVNAFSGISEVLREASTTAVPKVQGGLASDEDASPELPHGRQSDGSGNDSRESTSIEDGLSAHRGARSSSSDPVLSPSSRDFTPMSRRSAERFQAASGLLPPRSAEARTPETSRSEDESMSLASPRATPLSARSLPTPGSSGGDSGRPRAQSASKSKSLLSKMV